MAAKRIGQVSALFADAGTIVITAFISPMKRDREVARKAAGERFHDLRECRCRDVPRRSRATCRLGGAPNRLIFGWRSPWPRKAQPCSSAGLPPVCRAVWPTRRSFLLSALVKRASRRLRGRRPLCRPASRYACRTPAPTGRHLPDAR